MALPHSIHFHGHNSLVLAGSKDPYRDDLVLKLDNSPSTRTSSTSQLLASQSLLLEGDQPIDREDMIAISTTVVESREWWSHGDTVHGIGWSKMRMCLEGSSPLLAT